MATDTLNSINPNLSVMSVKELLAVANNQMIAAKLFTLLYEVYFASDLQHAQLSSAHEKLSNYVSDECNYAMDALAGRDTSELGIVSRAIGRQITINGPFYNVSSTEMAPEDKL